MSHDYIGSMEQRTKAELLRKLHHGPPILRVANVWDVASGAIVERASYAAIATTSAGIAFSSGYPDGEAIPVKEMLAQVERIARAVSVPVTADLEAGYDDIEATARGLVEAGAVGLNLEDFKDETFLEPAVQAEKIRVIRRLGESLGVPIVINARTDIYLYPSEDPAARFSRTVERLETYKHADADCAFVPGLSDEDAIARLVRAVQLPLNILVGTPHLHCVGSRNREWHV